MKAIIAAAAAAPADAAAAATAAVAAADAAAAAAAAVALLARLCVENHAALAELRIDGRGLHSFTLELNLSNSRTLP
jgi:hypothetical protein